MSEMDDGLVESVKKTLMDRINTPLFGFIFLSWIVFNWDNILFVLFSEVSIENRINAIKMADDFYIRGFIGPVLSGFFLSIAFPYLQWIVSYCQRTSQKLIDNNKKQREIDECVVIKELAKERAEAAAAIELEKAKNALALATKKMETEQVETRIEKLSEEYASLKKNLEEGKELLSQLEQSVFDEKGKETASRQRVDVLEIRSRQAMELIKTLEEQIALKDNILKSIDDIEKSARILRNDVTDVRDKTDKYPKTDVNGKTEYFSFDAVDLLTFTGDLYRSINSIDDSVAEVKAVLEEEN